MRKICEWSKCKEIASGEGLIKKDINKIFNYMQHDKKISGYKINLILLSKIGKAKIFPSDLNKNIKPILAQQFN